MQQPSGGFRLIVRRGPQPNQIYELTKDTITIGRDITNDITINDPEVSRHHSRMTLQGSGYVIEDLGSTNGTFVNGQRLTGARPLSPGETIGLGETVTLAHESTAFASAPAAAPPPQQQQMAPPQQQVAPQAAPSPYAPPAQQHPPQQPTPYAQQPYAPQQQYEPSPQPYGAYEEPRSGGWTRWLLLGCGCFIVLCVIGAVVGVILIDASCAWDQEPFASIIETITGEVPVCTN